MPKNIAKLRSEYKLQQLSKSDLDSNPFKQFDIWLDEAIESQVNEPTAMTLATADKSKKPSARIVLLKFVNENGFAFFTNFESRKGEQFKENPNAAIVFYWAELERQVRIEGAIEKLDDSISDSYFNSRPEKSRISAIISPQSREVPDRKFLEGKFEDFVKSEQEIKRPENWGGYICVPEMIEFWQGRENRLHDRLVYEKQGKDWKIKRLAP